MNRQRRVIKLCVVISLAMMLTGCWDLTGLDEKVFVIGIGLDKADEKGKINITYLIANAEMGSTMGGGTNEKSSMTITVRASDFISMKNIANSVISREISYDLLRLILVSEELAKDEEFIRFIYSAIKDREVKRTVHLLVSKEKAEDFFKINKPLFLSRPHKYYVNMLRRANEVGVIPESRLHYFLRITEADANLFLAAYTTTSIKKTEDEFRADENDAIAGDMRVEGETNNSQFLGAAVFLEGKMIGTLTGVENRMALMINDTTEVSDVLSVFPDPANKDYQISVRIKKTKNTRVNMDLHGKTPKIHVTLPIILDVLTDPAMNSPVESKKELEKIRKGMEKYMEGRVKELVQRTQQEFKAEPFGWSLYGRKEFKTLKEYKEFDWMKTYPDMKVDIDVSIRFGKFGEQPKTPSYKEIRD